MDNMFFHVHPVGVGADLSCPCPRNSPKWCCVFPLLASQSVIFCRLQPIVFVDDAGAMNRPPTPFGVHAAIYCVMNNPFRNVRWYILRYPFRYVLPRSPTFFHVHPVGVGTDLSCPCPRKSLKWCCAFPPLVLQFIIFCIPKWVVFVDDAGAMNLPLRLAECTLRIYCVMNNPFRNVRWYIFRSLFGNVF